MQAIPILVTVEDKGVTLLNTHVIQQQVDIIYPAQRTTLVLYPHVPITLPQDVEGVVYRGAYIYYLTPKHQDEVYTYTYVTYIHDNMRNILFVAYGALLGVGVILIGFITINYKRRKKFV